jgi:glycine betaine/choline ABC-type transport system substrate-binding protein
VALPGLAVVVGVAAYLSGNVGNGAASPRADTIRIGSKNFTEQFILAELMAQLIETHTDLSVERRFNLGGTMICHGALAAGEIDLYPEYTGTGLMAILDRDLLTDPDRVFEVVRGEYRERFDLEWLKPFGFNNTYAATVRSDAASERKWGTISDLAPHCDSLRAGVTSEFAERPDGYPGLCEAYGLTFESTLDFEPALMYQAVAAGEVDVIFAFATDGRIAAYDLQPLVDDKRFFPPYHAAPVVREEVLAAHPDLETVLNRLADKLDDGTMQRLNYEVDEKKRRPSRVAYEFLKSNAMI